MSEDVYVEPLLNIYKRGEDFRDCLEKTDIKVVDALLMYAKELRESSDVLLKIANHLRECDGISAEAEGHLISIRCPKQIAEIMIEQELVMYEQYDEVLEEVIIEDVVDVYDVVEDVVEEIVDEVIDYYEDED
jgi:DNA-binding protein YbaB